MTIETELAAGRDRPDPPIAPRRPSVRELHGETEPTTTPGCATMSIRRCATYLAEERAYYDARSRAPGRAGRAPRRRVGRADPRPGRGLGRMAAMQDLSTAPGHRREERISSFFGHDQENLPRKCCWTRTSSARRPATSMSAPASPARTARCSPGRPTPAAPRSTGCGSGTCVRRGPARRRSRARYPGVAWSADSRAPLLPGAGRAEPAVRGLAAPASARRPPTTCCSSPRSRRALRDDAARLPQRPVRGDHLGMPGHHGGPADPAGRPAGRTRSWSSPGDAAPSTTWTTRGPRGRRGGLRLYIVTDDGEPEFTLKRAPADAPGAADWTAGRLPGRRAGARGHPAARLRRDRRPAAADAAARR